MESLPSEARRDCLAQLQAQLTDRLKAHSDWDAYWQEIERIISDLREVGHDLWRHDYDGESRQLWGWDYMRPETAGQFQVQFDSHGSVEVFWRTENPQLGTGSSENR